MKKKLTKHGNSLALIIDKPLLELLHINEKTELVIDIKDGTLIIKPQKSKKAKENKDIDAIATQIMDKYEKVFKKLSKT